MNDLATLARLKNLVRFGVVAAVQMTPPRVRVKTGELTTTWLPWLAVRAGADREWDPPTAGEQVLLISPSGQLGNAVALACTAARTATARCEYDSIAHHLNATLVAGGTTNLVSTGGITIVGPITHKGDYTQTGNQTVTGKVTVSQDVIAAGISLVKHLHGGVMSGGAKTGAPE